MARDRRRVILTAGTVLLSAAAVYAVATRMWDRLGDVGQAFAGADYRYVVPSVGMLVLFYGFRVLRWRLFVRPVKDVSYLTLTSATCIGFMSSCVLPLRAGELIRPYVLHVRGGVGFGEAAGTALGLERVFDLIGVCCLLLATWLAMAIEGVPAGATGSPESGLALGEVWRYGLAFVALALVGLAGLMALAFAPSTVTKAAGVCLSPLPKSWRRWLTGFVASVAAPMRFMRSPRMVLVGLLLTLAQWASITLSTYMLSLGFGMGLSAASVLLIQLTVTVAVAPPQLPGYFGLFQLGAMTGAGLFGIPLDTALVFANVLWAVNVLPITIVGLLFLQREGLSLGRLTRASKRAAAAGMGGVPQDDGAPGP